MSTPIDHAKAIQGFSPAMQRSACRNCANAREIINERMPPYDTNSWQCRLGGFKVTAMAICNRHEFKKWTA